MKVSSIVKISGIVFAVVLLCLSVLPLMAQNSTTPQRTVPRPRGPIAGPAQQVAFAETHLRDALVAADLDAVQKALAADYSIALPDGKVWNKTQLLQSLKAGTWKPAAVELSEMRIKMLGATAGVVSARAEVRRATGTRAARNFRITDVWQKQPGEWQLVASQVTAIKQD